MFALEISFEDGVSQPETIFIRRPQALIGASDYAHVVLEDMAPLNFQIRLVRDVGRKFRTKPTALKEGVEVPALLDNLYDGGALVDVGPVKFFVTALDSDLVLKDAEPPDRAGVRVLRQACATQSPVFPAVVVRGTIGLVMSFVPDQPIYIGRSKQCALRLDAADISARHARMGFESGEFWIEDLGSTNGTFVNQQQISGRVNVPAGVPITLGRDIVIVGVSSNDQVLHVTRSGSDSQSRPAALERRYPVVLAVTEVARPARMVLQPGATIKIGRDPASDMWLGAPHVSRYHCSISLSKTGVLQVVDQSTNGTGYDGGFLRAGDVLELENEPKVLDFGGGGGVTVAVCFNEEQERAFIGANGALTTFSRGRDTPRTEMLNRDLTDLGAVGPVRRLDEDRLDMLEPGFWSWCVAVYRSLSLLGKMMLLMIVILSVVLVVVILSLIVPLFV